MAKLCEHGYFLEVAPRSCPKCRTDLDLIQREEIATLKATISRLRAYAEHTSGCAWHEYADEGLWRQPCDCGYDDLIKEIGE